MLLVLSATVKGQAQRGVGYFKGVVVDEEHAEPLPGANVVVENDYSIGAAANGQGTFLIKLPKGHYTFLVSYTGMFTDTLPVNITANDTVEKTIKLKVYVNKLQGVEISVGRFNQKLENLTVSMEVLQPKVIENKITTDIETVLDYVPGLNIVDGDPQIRGGSGFTFGVGSKVGVFIDGMPVLSADANQPLWDLIPTDNIKQIEVIKGASSVLSGSSSLSGAIYIKMADAPIKPVTKMMLYCGAYSNPKYAYMKWWNHFPYIGGFSVSHARVVNNTDVIISANVKFDHGYEGPPKPGPLVVDTVTNFSESQMAEKRVRVNFNLRHRNQKIKGLFYGLNGNMMYNDTKLALAWLDDSVGFYQSYPGGVLLTKNFVFYVDPFISYFTALGVRHNFKARYMYSATDMSNDQNTKSSIIYGDYNFRKDYHFLGELKFIGGISTQYNSVLSDVYVGAGNRNNTLLNVSAYSEIQDKFFNTLNVSVGLRLETYSLNGASVEMKPVFRAGATLKVLRETYVRGSYGQGYRYPTIAERFIRFSSGVIGVFDNPNLKPETSTNAEVGVKQGFKFSKFFGYLDVSVFQQDYDNTIEYLFGFWDSTYTFAIGGFKFLNTGKSRILGADISLTGKAALAKNLQMNLMAGYTYISPKAMEPDYVFAKDYSYNGGTDFSYNSTSVNPENHILKYRFLHTFKADVEFVYKGLASGLSMKYYSPIVNLDKSIEDFETATSNTGGTTQPVKYMNYFYHHNNGNLVMDFRISYEFNHRHKISFIANNFTNKWYSIRPLKAEAMRSILLQYALKL